MPWRHKEQALCIWLESTLESRVIKSIVSHRGREQFSHSEYTDKIAEKDRATIELYRSLYERGYFTNPRCRKSPEEVGSDLDQGWSHLEVVKVDPLRTQAQVRKLIDAHAYLVHRPNVDEAIDPEIESLVEWVDLASFIIKTPMENEDSGEGRRRELYGHILDCVRDLERRGVTVLAGIMDAPQDGLPDWKVAIISVTPKSRDPGAAKRRAVFVDRRCVQLPPMKAA